MHPDAHVNNQQETKQETLFVFVTAQGRVMARLSNGIVVDVTDHCDLLPRHVCHSGRNGLEMREAVRAA